MGSRTASSTSSTRTASGSAALSLEISEMAGAFIRGRTARALTANTRTTFVTVSVGSSPAMTTTNARSRTRDSTSAAFSKKSANCTQKPSCWPIGLVLVLGCM
eukprot:Amastigsp_a509342_27.p3 type:complete len:103 gc:universal Amastigsp_a509342_27:286-594(+)